MTATSTMDLEWVGTAGVDDRTLRAYVDATTDCSTTRPAHPASASLAPVLLVREPLRAAVEHLVGTGRGGPTTVLHVSQDIELDRPLRPDVSHQVRCRIAACVPSSLGALVYIGGTVDDDAGRVCAMTVGLFLPGYDGTRLGRRPPAARIDTSSDRRVGWTETVRTTSDQAARYALASGDVNPIHLIPTAARMAGFDRPVLHGMCALALVVSAIGAPNGASVRRVATRFGAPVHPGDDLVVDCRSRPGASAVAWSARTTRGVAMKSGVIVFERGGD